MSFSNSSDSEGDKNEIVNELEFFADEICRAPVIVEKSQVPKLKNMKDEAIKVVTTKYEALYGKPLDAKGLLKKINNMKTRLKKKTDMKKTGNKKIKLLGWEKKLHTALQGDSNPTITRIEGAMQFGVGETHESVESLPSKRKLSTEKPETHEAVSAQPILPPKRKLPTDKFETDETKVLTNKELQRLVLLQQYRRSKIQQEYYEKKLEIINRKNISSVNTINDGNNSYFNL